MMIVDDEDRCIDESICLCCREEDEPADLLFKDNDDFELKIYRDIYDINKCNHYLLKIPLDELKYSELAKQNNNYAIFKWLGRVNVAEPMAMITVTLWVVYDDKVVGIFNIPTRYIFDKDADVEWTHSTCTVEIKNDLIRLFRLL